VAIVDHGRVVAQGPISDIAGGAEKSILVATADPDATLGIARSHVAVTAAVAAADGIRIVLRPDVELDVVAADLNRRLVGAGVDVHRLEPVRVTLEQRFLQITTRLGEAA
jgi:ABC-2 type transport system ATP-binding protein